jgi:hypothetical protein
MRPREAGIKGNQTTKIVSKNVTCLILGDLPDVCALGERRARPEVHVRAVQVRAGRVCAVGLSMANIMLRNVSCYLRYSKQWKCEQDGPKQAYL